MFFLWAKTYNQIKLSYFVEGVEREVLHDKDDVLVHCDAPHPPPLHIHRHLSVSDKKICIRQKIGIWQKKSVSAKKKSVSAKKDCIRQNKSVSGKRNLYLIKRSNVKVYHCILHRWVFVCHPTWVLTANQRRSFHLLLSGYF